MPDEEDEEDCHLLNRKPSDTELVGDAKGQSATRTVKAVRLWSTLVASA